MLYLMTELEDGGAFAWGMCAILDWLYIYFKTC